MRLYVVRHGKAEPRADSGMDADRALTHRGQRQAAFLSGAISQIEPEIRIVSSGAVRARETAEFVARACGVGLSFDDRLFVEEPVGPVVELIESGAEAGGVLGLFGHNNQLTELVGVLTEGVNGGAEWLRTGEASVIELDLERPIGGSRELARLRLEEG